MPASPLSLLGACLHTFPPSFLCAKALLVTPCWSHPAPFSLSLPPSRTRAHTQDLEDVRGIMNVLKEVREKESEIDNLIGPIEEMYGLLLRYEVRVPKEETTMVSDLRYGWKKLRKLSTDITDNLTRLQVNLPSSFLLGNGSPFLSPGSSSSSVRATFRLPF
jgi:hypothetical protein